MDTQLRRSRGILLDMASDKKKKQETKVGDLVTTSNGRVGVITSLRNNNSADVVWLSDSQRGLVNLWWLYIFSKNRKKIE